MKKTVHCKVCGSLLATYDPETAAPCPFWCLICNEQRCPECGDVLDVEGKEGDEVYELCGPGCKCGWTHCGSCV